MSMVSPFLWNTVYVRATQSTAIIIPVFADWRKWSTAKSHRHDSANRIMSSLYLHTHTHPFNGPLFGTTRVSRYQKGKTNLDFAEARDSEWQWHQLDHMQVRTSLQRDNHVSTPPLSFLKAGCPSCRPTNSVKTLKANSLYLYVTKKTRNRKNRFFSRRERYGIRLGLKSHECKRQ